MKDKDLYRRLGRLLRARRRLLHLTQAQVAARCGTTFQQVQKYESGLAAFSVGRLARLAEALQTSACSLLESALELTPWTPLPPAPQLASGSSQAEGPPRT